jgi:hypothetical protein
MGRRDRKSISLPHSVIVKAPGLLPMHYTSKELAEELGVPQYTVKLWIEGGLPHHHDGRNYLMIDGRDVASWVENQRRVKAGPRMEEGQAYCLRCKKRVTMLNPAKARDRNRILLKGNCSFCGGTVNVGIKHGQP